MQVMNLVQINHISDMLLTAGGNEEILKEQGVRLAIATELAGNPSVLLLDEPLKGLDTHASSHIIECLRVCLLTTLFAGKTCYFCSVTACLMEMIVFHAYDEAPIKFPLNSV
jgi:ABC-type Na+ transport system ATPase subunit NatA